MQAILFDFDGTIAETEQDGHRIAYNQAFAELGLAWIWDRALYHEMLFVAGGKERIHHYMASYAPPLPDPAPADLVDRIHAAKVRRFGEIARCMPFRPGVRRLILEAKRAGVKLAVATTASAPGVKSVLSQDDEVLAAFDVFAAGDVVAHKKPAPDIYLWALDRLDVPARDCVAIEDSSIGYSASREARIATLITTNSDTRSHRFDGALAILSDLGEPDKPATIFAGPVPPKGFVDLAYLDAILSDSLRSCGNERPNTWVE